MSEQILDTDIGKIHIIKKPRRKRLSLSFTPDGHIKVLAPRYASNFEIKRFINSNLDWIKANQPERTFIKHGDRIGKEHTVQIKPHDSDKVKTYVRSNIIRILHPEELDINTDEVQSAGRKAANRALRAESEKYIPSAVEEYSMQTGFKPKSYRLKNMTTRWGSCSSLGNLNFSIYLIQLPFDLVDYVIIHELCHLEHPNHSKDFWEEVGKYVADLKEKKKLIKQYSTKLIVNP